MLEPEKNAKRILEDWVAGCRKRNPSGKIELGDVSNWVEKRFEIDETCPGLDSLEGVFLLFCLGSLLSFGGGNYKARTSEIKSKYHALMSRRFGPDSIGRPFSEERRARFMAIDLNLQNLASKYSASNLLQEWWEAKKDSCDGDVGMAAEGMLREIQGWSYKTGQGKNRALFTVKVFWIARELHSNDIWSDFPVEYCCVPDRYVKNALCKLFGIANFKRMFRISYRNPSFHLDSAILMSKKVCELISSEKIDGHYPYDLPFFERGYEEKRRQRVRMNGIGYSKNCFA